MHLLPQFATRHQNITPLLNTIHHCDAMDLLARLPDASIDMVLADLPYGVTACKWDTVIPIEPMWEQLKRIVKPRSAIVLTATQPFTSRLVSSNYEMYRHSWVWDKKLPNGMLHAKYKPMQQHEDVLVFSKNPCVYYPIMQKRKSVKKSKLYSNSDNYKTDLTGIETVYSHTYPKTIIAVSNADQANKVHPTQKPSALFEYLIKTYTQENEIVLDFTCGSGTTGVACMRSNRQFICGDITQEYVDIANQRLQATNPYVATELSNGQKQLSLFEQEQAS